MAVAGTVRLARGAVACPARAQGRLAFLPQLAAIDRSFPLLLQNSSCSAAGENSVPSARPRRRSGRARRRRR
jgi:hypothetical protein